MLSKYKRSKTCQTSPSSHHDDACVPDIQKPETIGCLETTLWTDNEKQSFVKSRTRKVEYYLIKFHAHYSSPAQYIPFVKIHFSVVTRNF